MWNKILFQNYFRGLLELTNIFQQATWLAVSEIRSVSARLFAGSICRRRVWYRALSLCISLCIRSSSIILILYATLVSNFVSFAASIAGEKSRTESLNHSPSLFDVPGTEALTLRNMFNVVRWNTFRSISKPCYFRCNHDLSGCRKKTVVETSGHASGRMVSGYRSWRARMTDDCKLTPTQNAAV